MPGATVNIQLLGGVMLARPGALPVPTSARAVSLLAYLVARAGRPQPRAHLAALLWPDSSDAQARTNLRRELHRLRDLLGSLDCLVVEGGTLLWRDDPRCEVDVRVFARACAAAREGAAAGDEAVVAEGVATALAGYHGAFLPGRHEEWVAEVRDELRRDCVALCDLAVEFWRRRDDPAAALPVAERRVELDPLAEEGYRTLMRVQEACGDRAAAVATYHRCASVLGQELGVEPSAELHTRLDRLLVASPGDAGPAVVPGSPELVGRAAERDRLRAAWSRGTGLVLVVGEPGVGKTRLVAELAAEVQREDGVVCAARCFATTGGLPLAPVADWLRTPYLREAVRRLDPVWRLEAERLAPSREASQADPTERPVAGARAKVDAWRRIRFFEGLARAVAAVGRPVLLTLDDLHWCDRTTLSWLSFLLAFPSTTPVVVVATARSDELAGSALAGPVAAMEAAGRVDRVVLTGLGNSDVARLGRAVLGRTLTAEEVTLLRTATEGNPYAVIEVLRAAGPGEELVPSGVRGILATRVQRLPSRARHVAELVAALGHGTALDVILEASDLDADHVVAAVDLLWRHRVLEQAGVGYDFVHDLLRDAVYEEVSPPRRWLLHRRLAQALELVHAAHRDEVAGELAEQYERSGQVERALACSATAMARAAAVFAHADAVRIGEHRLELIRELPPGRRREEKELEVHLDVLPPLNAWRGYSCPDLVTHASRAAEIAERLGRVRDQASARVSLFASTFVQGRTRVSHEHALRALELSDAAPELAAQARLAAAGSALSLGRVVEADAHFATGCALAGDSDSLPIGTRTVVHATGWWAHATWLLGDPAGARRARDASVAHARETGHPYSLAVALAYAAVTDQLLGDVDGLVATVSELTGLCRRYGFAYYDQWAAVLGAWAAGPAGLGQATAAVDALVAEGSLARLPYWLALLADLHRQAGNDVAAAGDLARAERSALEDEDVWWLPEVLRARAGLESPDAARCTLTEAVSIAGGHGSAALLDRATAALASLG